MWKAHNSQEMSVDYALLSHMETPSRYAVAVGEKPTADWGKGLRDEFSFYSAIPA